MFYGTKICLFFYFGKSKRNFYKKYFCICEEFANFGDETRKKE